MRRTRRHRRSGRERYNLHKKIAIGAGAAAVVLLIFMVGTLAGNRDGKGEKINDRTTKALTAEVLTAEPPTTEEPFTEEPATETPSDEEPATEASSAEEPTTEATSAEAIASERDRLFDHSLFIGDSRSAGLAQYADLGKADFFTGSGMSVYNIRKAKVIVENAQKKTLEEMLSEKKYDTIYLMIGINELGYSYEKTVDRYASFVEWLQEMEPEAEIVLQANLHMTKEKSETDEIFNNQNINRFNESVKTLAEETGRMYLDVNPLFDDGEGNLSEDYAVDEAHILGKYYADWADWIYEQRTKD